MKHLNAIGLVCRFFGGMCLAVAAVGLIVDKPLPLETTIGAGLFLIGCLIEILTRE